MAFQYVLVKNSGRGRGYLPTIMPEASFSDLFKFDYKIWGMAKGDLNDWQLIKRKESGH